MSWFVHLMVLLDEVLWRVRLVFMKCHLCCCHILWFIVCDNLMTVIPKEKDTYNGKSESFDRSLVNPEWGRERAMGEKCVFKTSKMKSLDANRYPCLKFTIICTFTMRVVIWLRSDCTFLFHCLVLTVLTGIVHLLKCDFIWSRLSLINRVWFIILYTF